MTGVNGIIPTYVHIDSVHECVYMNRMAVTLNMFT